MNQQLQLFLLLSIVSILTLSGVYQMFQYKFSEMRGEMENGKDERIEELLRWKAEVAKNEEAERELVIQQGKAVAELAVLQHRLKEVEKSIPEAERKLAEDLQKQELELQIKINNLVGEIQRLEDEAPNREARESDDDTGKNDLPSYCSCCYRCRCQCCCCSCCCFSSSLLRLRPFSSFILRSSFSLFFQLPKMKHPLRHSLECIEPSTEEQFVVKMAEP
jgi:hypothetical protein